MNQKDLASELQYNANNQITYGGISPYTCLYGQAPREPWSDETDQLSGDDNLLPFFEHIHIRHRSIGAFHQALLRFRMERSLQARARTDHAESYAIGEHVDIFLRPSRKDQEGWRGPGVIVDFVGEGQCSVRWQSVVRDIPFHHVRPHISVSSSSVLPIPPEERSTDPAIDAAESDEPTAAEEAHFAYFSQFGATEAYFQEDNSDQLRNPYFQTLVSLAASLPIGTQQLHAVQPSKNGNHVWTRDAQRDGRVIYSVGARLASHLHIKNYTGISLLAGRHGIPLPNVSRSHCFVWTTDPRFIKCTQQRGSNQLDWVRDGSITDIKELHLVHAFVLYEAKEDIPPLQELLKGLDGQPEEPFQSEGRVREEWPDQQDLHIDAGPSISERDEMENNAEVDEDVSASMFFAAVLKQNISKTPLLTCARRERVFSKDKLPDAAENVTKGHSSYETFRERTTENTSMPDVFGLEGWYTIEENGFYPVERSQRPLTKADLSSPKVVAELMAARLKELRSFVENRVGHPELRTEWEARTSKGAIPSRWVEIFKYKAGELIVKARLCLKGFAEPVAAGEQTNSPTANRLSHRLICKVAAEQHWVLGSLDVSNAFLKGYTFDELAQLGESREAVAFVPAEDVWSLLAEIDSSTYSKTLADPSKWIFVLSKSVYGLRDAPLRWHMKCISTLKKHHWRSTRHDSCCFILVIEGTLRGILTLHVDDLLATGATGVLEHLEEVLLSEFGGLTFERAAFRHFGVDVLQHPETFVVTASQKKYIDDLSPIEMPTRSNKEMKAPPLLVTAYRALVSGVAWVGVTSPQALASASLLQSYLPEPTFENLAMANTNLAQLKATYVPLTYKKIPLPHRLLDIADSSLANVARYSQGGFLVLLVHDSQEALCDDFVLLDFKSSKSKRVATSSMHAEALSCLSSIESSTFLQSFLLELSLPNLTAIELLSPELHDPMLKIVQVTDCNDLYEVLTVAAQPSLTNKHLGLYVAAIREFVQCGRISALVWADTRDMIANGMTKLNDNGEVPLEGLNDCILNGFWAPKHPYQYNRTWCYA